MTEPRWYCITSDGAATLCVDQADAEQNAADADIQFPRRAPHRAVQLVAVEAASIPDGSQDWAGMDGTTAYWLIQRHADGWAEAGKMMREWLAANAAPQPQQAAPVAVPDGWKPVPVEATREMCAAAVMYANGSAVYKNVIGEVLAIEERIYGEVYEAMLAASPQAAPAQTQQAPAPQRKALTPDELADKCEAWLQTGVAPNIVDAYEAGYRHAERAHNIPQADQQEKTQ